MSFYEYNNIEPSNYLPSNSIPPPKYIGGIGEPCNSSLDCHQYLKCTEFSPSLALHPSDGDELRSRPEGSSIRQCTNWIPPQVSPIIEKFQNVSKSPPEEINNVQYNSKFKANSGKNYYSYY